MSKIYRVSVHAHYPGAAMKILKLNVKGETTIQQIVGHAEKKLEDPPARLTIAMIEEKK